MAKPCPILGKTEILSGSESGMCVPVVSRRPLVSRLTQTMLADGGLFEFRAHGAEVVGRRNHRKEDDQHASEREQEVQGGKFARMSVVAAAPEPVGRQSQQQPCEIQK